MSALAPTKIQAYKKRLVIAPNEKANKNFEDAKIKFSSLSNFSTLMKIAKDKKFISEEDFNIAIEWNKNPDKWQK